MINFIKNLFKSSNTANIDKILREYEAITFLIEECYSMDDFIHCKKKIRRFEHQWNVGEENLPGPKFSKKLNDLYNRRLVKQKYYIGLHAEKTRKKTV